MHTLLVTLMLGLSTFGGVAPSLVAHQPPTAVPDPLDNSVTVQNNRTVPVTIYMEYGAFDRRLGVVPPLQTATLALPTWAVNGRQSIQLFVHPEGELDLASQVFSLGPPARLGIVVPARGAIPPSTAHVMTAVIPPEELADATLTVDNPRDQAVTVFAERGDFDLRVGEVPAHSQATLPFPKSAVGPANSIQIFVHPEGGADLSSETMQVRRGQHLGLHVPLH
jgi:hypothetical protein